MSLADFRDQPRAREHPSYEGSVLAPVAPEWSTGEVLLGAAYRRLLLNVQEATVDPGQIADLPGRLGQDEVWEDLLIGQGGLASPVLGGQRGRLILKQLMPLVPEVARHACALGRPRSRWDPARLLLSAIGSGKGEPAAAGVVARLRDALAVGDRDDLFARFVEESLRALALPGNPPVDPGFPAPAYRGHEGQRMSPAERFCQDLEAVLALKPLLTRRQWTVFLEALLRLALGLHTLWVCRLNKVVWEQAVSASEGGVAVGSREIERAAWEGQRDNDPLLELGRDGIPSIRKRIEDYAVARIGLNVALHAMVDAGVAWPGGKLGEPGPSRGTVPESLASFLDHVATHAANVRVAVGALGYPSLQEACRAIADGQLPLLSFKSGFTKNLLEFLRHTLGQLSTQADEERSYDQAYLLIKRNPRDRSSPWPVQPGPATLIMLVHACCRSLEGLPASMEDLRSHLADYGIFAPAGELQGGRCGRDLERLGLVVDSPDAGGGRLLVDPFPGRIS